MDTTSARIIGDVPAAHLPYEEAPAAPVPRDRITAGGVALAICALSLGMSTFPGLRPALGTLLLHPIHTIIPLVFLVAAPKNLPRVPAKITLAIVACVLMFALTAFAAKGGLEPSVKIAASAVTILAAATALRTEADFRLVVVCMALAGLMSSMRAFGAETDAASLTGVNPMQGIANKNAFSLYILPPLLLSGYLALQPTTSRIIRLFLACCMIVHVYSMFLTANRSGWAGAVLVGFLLALRAVRRLRQLILLLMLSGLVTFLNSRYGDTEMINHKITQTREGYSSDTLRMSLIKDALEVAAANPILGVSPQRLPYEMARRSGVMGESIEAHNVFAMIAGGGGFLLTAAFIALFLVLVRRPKGWVRERSRMKDGDAHYLLRSFVILWCVRGSFTAEILFNPTFSFAIGLCIALCMMRGLWSGGEPAGAQS